MVCAGMRRTVFEIRTLLAAPLAGLALLSCAWLPPGAGAAQAVRLPASLTPERLGAGTTIGFGFTVSTTTGRVPSPLTGVELLYPANLGLATSGLGPRNLHREHPRNGTAPKAAPPSRRWATARGSWRSPSAPRSSREPAHDQSLHGPSQQGHLGLVFYAGANAPSTREIVFGGLVLPASEPYGGDLATTIPLVPTLPGRPTPRSSSSPPRSAPSTSPTTNTTRPLPPLPPPRHHPAPLLPGRRLPLRGPLHLPNGTHAAARDRRALPRRP